MRLLRLLVYCSLVVGSTTLGANLLTNGDFELPGAAFLVGNQPANYASFNNGSLTGWTSAVGNGDNPANYYSGTNSGAFWIPNPQSGSYCVQLDSSDVANPSYSTGGSLSQTVALVANVNYVLTFYMSAETGHGVSVTSQINVILNGGGFSNQTTSFQASWNGANKTTPGSWVKCTLNFTPTASGNVTLKFLDVYVNNPASSNASLDNIDLEVLPEMTPWTMTAAFVALAVSASIWKARPRRFVSKVSASTGTNQSAWRPALSSPVASQKQHCNWPPYQTCRSSPLSNKS